MKKVKFIFLNALPILAMIALIPLVQSDYILTLLYILIISIAFWVKYNPKDFTVFLVGFCLLTASELIFVSTGVETFTRSTLFGWLPLWLPFLWGYAFVAIKRVALMI